MAYHWIKWVHISTVVFTFSFFSLRLYWMIRHPRLVRQPWARRLSQINDTLLLAAGISLAMLSGQYPLAAPWLTAKLSALILYIVLGMFALKWGKSLRIRITSGLFALMTGGYILAVALCRTPYPWICF